MAVKTYKKGSSTKLSANFRAREFDCKCTKYCSTTLIDEQLVVYLQKIREYFNKPVYIESAYRCPGHNDVVPNASKTSKHLEGRAADIQVEGIAPAEVAKYAETIGVKGIGLYDSDADGHFVHIDTRTTKSFWIGHAQKPASTFGGNPKPELEVDGIWGKDTTIATQKFFKLTADGIVSNQSAKQRPYLSAASTKSWEFKNSGYSAGSAMIKALQKHVGAGADGIMGRNSVIAMQKFLIKKGFLAGKADGYMGSQTVSAWQRYLNSIV